MYLGPGQLHHLLPLIDMITMRLATIAMCHKSLQNWYLRRIFNIYGLHEVNTPDVQKNRNREAFKVIAFLSNAKGTMNLGAIAPKPFHSCPNLLIQILPRKLGAANTRCLRVKYLSNTGNKPS